MVSSSIRAALCGAAVACGLACAHAAAADTGQQKCFFIKDWDGWKAPSTDVLYLKVHRAIYRVDLSSGSDLLDAPDMKLISRFPGNSSVCIASDLDLTLIDGHGYRQALIARRITRLSPEEAAAIPPKFRP